MPENKEKSFWKRGWKSLIRFREELEKDSVASNPRKPVDCCNPPATKKADPGNNYKINE